MYSKYLALLLVAFKVAYAAPTLSGRSTSLGSGGCSPSYPGGFGISVINDGQVQGPLAKRQAPGNPSAGSKPLTVYLENGILKDSQGRQGYIADNYQFQFDAPPQATPYATSGFSVCPDSTIGLNGSNVFYQCASGNFSNIYDRSWAPHCQPIHLRVVEQGSDSAQHF
ncbi:hypothetical protein EV426DRAFT_536253 [Tirmania nivea]|nr:hypothetical protein EV426DRAFT_536253 [Tirmania nivea]